MANINKNNTQITFSPENNTIPITFQNNLNNPLLTLSSSSIIINAPIIKTTYDSSFNQLCGRTSIFNTGNILYSQTYAEIALILPIGVWCIQGSFRVTYTNYNTPNTNIPLRIYTRCGLVSTTSIGSYSSNSTTHYYGPSLYYDTNFQYGGLYPVQNSTPSLFNYTFTQIFNISCVVPLSSSTTVYVSGVYGPNATASVIGFNGITCSLVTNAFRIG